MCVFIGGGGHTRTWVSGNHTQAEGGPAGTPSQSFDHSARAPWYTWPVFALHPPCGIVIPQPINAPRRTPNGRPSLKGCAVTVMIVPTRKVSLVMPKRASAAAEPVSTPHCAGFPSFRTGDP